MATEKTPSSKHGRLREEEDQRDEHKSVFHEHSEHVELERAKNREMHKAMERVAAQKPVAKPAPKAKPDITQRMDALRAALADKYPHNDVEVLPDGLKVAVPGGSLMIESEKVAKCADSAELRAYIDALPIL